ncbi:zinc ribbon domain-containing protein [Methyloterricola oryzae]|uniref:zinc ribbon domain-containing protein n=1 Tax=Methyloterricola oryzae TaxID=1495050 RepID=UPI0009E3A77D|nr:zinc ribbon domain-containing protein [Methyloterricola oryzae]
MFCRYCGKELKDTATVCTACGKPVDALSSGAAPKGSRWSFSEMVGLIGATLFIPPVGIVMGLLGLRNEAKKVQAAILLTISVFMSLVMLAVVLGL